MVAPIDYSLNVPTPDSALAQGINVGTTLANNDALRQAQTVELQQKQFVLKQAQEQAADLSRLSSMPNPTAADIGRVAFKYPQLGEKFKPTWDALTAEQQQQKLQTSTPIFAALNSARPDLAEQLLQQQVDALTNSKASPQDIQAAQTWLKMVQQAPAHAKVIAGTYLASVMGKDKFEAAFGKVGSEQRENAAAPGKIAETASVTSKNNADAAATTAKAPAEVANLNSQVLERAGRLALDTDKLQSETALKVQELTQKYNQVTPDARKVINEAAGSSVMATNSAAQMRGLADQFAAASAAGGAIGSASEKFKELTGGQDYMTQLRREYTRIRATQVNALLPPGPASDKDILNAQAGFLKETADPKEIASWLRGVAKLQDYQAKLDDAKGEWVAAVGHLGKTPKDIEVGGVKVPAGYTLTDYLKRTLAAPGPATTPPKPRGNYMDRYGTKKEPGL